jgi:hypothetical protein
LLIVLRDPVSRWRAGFLQYWCSARIKHRIKEQGNGVFGELFNQAYRDIELDPHTYKQVSFFEGVNLSQASFVYFNNTLHTTVDKWMTNCGILYNQKETRFNSTTDSSFKSYAASKLGFKIKNSDIIDRVKDYYEEDYKLINSVDFLNR